MTETMLLNTASQGLKDAELFSWSLDKLLSWGLSDSALYRLKLFLLDLRKHNITKTPADRTDLASIKVFHSTATGQMENLGIRSCGVMSTPQWDILCEDILFIQGKTQAELKKATQSFMSVPNVTREVHQRACTRSEITNLAASAKGPLHAVRGENDEFTLFCVYKLGEPLKYNAQSFPVIDWRRALS